MRSPFSTCPTAISSQKELINTYTLKHVYFLHILVNWSVIGKDEGEKKSIAPDEGLEPATLRFLAPYSA